MLQLPMYQYIYHVTITYTRFCPYSLTAQSRGPCVCFLKIPFGLSLVFKKCLVRQVLLKSAVGGRGAQPPSDAGRDLLTLKYWTGKKRYSNPVHALNAYFHQLVTGLRNMLQAAQMRAGLGSQGRRYTSINTHQQCIHYYIRVSTWSSVPQER
jgi:hypothetical protein